MLNNFIYAQTKDLFLEALGAGNILDEAIVFIEDTKEIWNHGTYFAGESIDPDDFELLKASVSDLETAVENIPSELVYEVSYADLTSETTTQEFYDSIVEAYNANKRFRVSELGYLFEVTYLDEYNGLIQMVVPMFEPDNNGAITNLSFFGKQVYSNLQTVILPPRTLSFQTSGSGTKFLADNGTYVEPDSTISATSENVVMNKAVANALDEINATFDSYVTKEAFENEIYYFYPNNATIVGPDSCANPCEYTWETTTEGVNGSYQTQWTLSNDAATVSSDNNSTCVVTPSATILEPTETTLTLTLIKNYDQKVLATASKTIVVSPLGAVITSLTNAPIQTALYSAGLVEHEHYTTEEEAAAITADQLQTGTSYSTSIFYAQRSSITHFEEFEYFTGLTVVPQFLFYGCNQMTKISIPKTVLEIGNRAFYNCSYLDTLKIGSQVTTFGSSCFYNCNRIANLYIDNLDWWLLSQMSNIPNCTNTRKFYILDQDGNYTLTKELEISSSVTSIRANAFNDTNITSILIPSSVTSIGNNAFYNCSSLENVYGCSGITSVNYTAFTNCNADIKLEETVPFGLFTNSQTIVKATSGKYPFSYTPMALMLGETTFYADAGAYFADGTSEKTLTLAYTGGVEDLTDNFIIASRTLTINSNFSDTRYSVSFTSSTDGSVSTTEVGPGSTILNVQGGSSITITPLTTIEDYTTPSVYGTTLSNTSATLTVTMTYKEIIDVRIQHVNGDLYTTDEWTTNGYSNDNANGVAVISASAAFVIAKTESESKLTWGALGETITGLLSYDSSQAAVLDFDGKNNTTKIIAYSTTEAPAAEYCNSYTFPNGNTGYLGSLGEWITALNNKVAITEAMSLIGGTAFSYGSYWSSTIHLNRYSWYAYTPVANSFANDLRYEEYYVRAFSTISKLTINCNRNDIKFNITYTPWNKDTEKTVTKSNGMHTSILPKKNTTVIISVSPNYDWAELNTYSQTFTYTGEDISATFTSSLEPGVFIQHVNGDLYTTDEWTNEWTADGYSNDFANGVAVIDSNCAFVIAKENVSTSTLKWGGHRKEITGIVTTSDSSRAVLDFDGKNNTTKIIEQLDGYTDSESVTGAPAAEACANYTFSNGNTGYLGSLGEWNVAYNNKTAIVEAISLIGGTAITSSSYWTSTQCSSTYSWYLYWNNGQMNTYTRNTGSFLVRAFSAL